MRVPVGVQAGGSRLSVDSPLAGSCSSRLRVYSGIGTILSSTRCSIMDWLDDLVAGSGPRLLEEDDINRFSLFAGEMDFRLGGGEEESTCIDGISRCEILSGGV